MHSGDTGHELASSSVLIVGTGREAHAVAAIVQPLAGSVFAIDESDGIGAAAWRSEWGGRVPLLVGEQLAAPDVFAGVDVAVVSPGFSKHHPIVVRLREAGVAITSGTELWMRGHAATTTAVTGSKGKSTTSSLIQHLYSRLRGEAVLGGNIGIPLLALPEAEHSVVELSSYQCSTLTVSPQTVVLTSLFPEHLDWHGSEDDYYADKLNIVAHSPGRVIVNARDLRLGAQVKLRYPGLHLTSAGLDRGFHLVVHEGESWFALDGHPLMPRSLLALKGDHNAVNACLALAAIDDESFRVADNVEAVAEALASFEPLGHRLEEIPDASGLTFVDDSLSTSPFAALEAVRAFSPQPVTLLVGGQDRGVDYAPLFEFLAATPIAAVIGLPGSGEALVSRLPAGQRSAVAGSMEEAVSLARGLTPDGGFVLLSPAAPSYGLYRNFEERAADFRRAIAATA